MKRLFLSLVAGVLLAASTQAAPVTISTLVGSGNLIAGADPFFWANVDLAALGSVSTPGVSCGATCATYTLDYLNFAVAGLDVYPVSSPMLQVDYNPSGNSSYQIYGTISVASTYVVNILLQLSIPFGALDANSLTNLASLPPTAISADGSQFIYGIVAGGPPVVGIFGVNGGNLAQLADESTVPEPGSAGLMLFGAAALFAAARRRAR